MSKYRQVKILSVVALVVAIVGMSLGFAAFSATLNISSSAIVKPSSEDFKIVVSNSSTDYDENEIYPIVEGDASGSVMTFLNNGNKISANVDANFTEPGQAVKYKFYVHNIGEYDAHFKVVFNEVDGTSLKKVCTIPQDSGASSDLVKLACEDINIFFRFAFYGQYIDVTDDMAFSDLILPKKYYTGVELIIEYPEGSTMVDGKFNVQFGDIEGTYSTVD